MGGEKNELSGIIINFYDEFKNIGESSIRLSEIEMRKDRFTFIDTHFKGKYDNKKAPG